jgi:alpha-N-arabinofuranosidase
MIRTVTRFLVMAGLLFASSAAAQTATIDIDASHSGPRVNPHMYGIFLEEINHGVDGGLYAELIRNRAFEDGRPPEGYELRNGRWVDANGFPAGLEEFGYEVGGLPFWSFIREGDAKGDMHLETSGGITKESGYCLRLDVDDIAKGRIGVANEGFFGIGVKEGEEYKLSLHARSSGGFTGSLRVRLEDSAGNACSDEVVIENIG